MAKMQEFKCPCCGGSIEFDSSVQKMKCPYCGNIDTRVIDSRHCQNMRSLWKRKSRRI